MFAPEVQEAIQKQIIEDGIRRLAKRYAAGDTDASMNLLMRLRTAFGLPLRTPAGEAVEPAVLLVYPFEQECRQEAFHALWTLEYALQEAAAGTPAPLTPGSEMGAIAYLSNLVTHIEADAIKARKARAEAEERKMYEEQRQQLQEEVRRAWDAYHAANEAMHRAKQKMEEQLSPQEKEANRLCTEWNEAQERLRKFDKSHLIATRDSSVTPLARNKQGEP